MTASITPAQVPPAAPKYARFSRRLQGIAIDFMLLSVAMVVALQLATAFNSTNVARVVGFIFLAGFLLYEPLMVSIMGGTVGHYVSNLRVVDDRSSGNISLLKAFARLAIKFVLSWWSFVIMTAARRHQAVHDLLTRSTVQIRDPAKALPSHFSHERIGLASPDMPSRARRIAVILLYLVGSTVLLVLLVAALIELRLYFPHCRNFGKCSEIEKLVDLALGILTVVIWALCIGWGWQGRLWGARRRVAKNGT
jgi:uncharacterized RDD family membrane protein YckC